MAELANTRSPRVFSATISSSSSGRMTKVVPFPGGFTPSGAVSGLGWVMQTGLIGSWAQCGVGGGVGCTVHLTHGAKDDIMHVGALQFIG